MNLEDTIQQTLSEMAKLNPDFKHVKSRNSLTRKTKFKQDSLQITGHQRGDYYCLTPHVWVRINEIEKIYSNITSLEKKYHGSSVTLGGKLGKLVNSPSDFLPSSQNIDYDISKEEEMQTTVTELNKLFNGFCREYFQRFESISEVDKVFNTNLDSRSIHVFMKGHRCTKGLIIAKILKSDNYDELIQKYDQMIEPVTDFYKNEYVGVKELLKDFKV